LPVLANLFMHYAFDQWLTRGHPDVLFERYADDAVVHCVSETRAHQVGERPTLWRDAHAAAEAQAAAERIAAVPAQLVAATAAHEAGRAALNEPGRAQVRAILDERRARRQ